MTLLEQIVKRLESNIEYYERLYTVELNLLQDKKKPHKAKVAQVSQRSVQQRKIQLETAKAQLFDVLEIINKQNYEEK